MKNELAELIRDARDANHFLILMKKRGALEMVALYRYQRRRDMQRARDLKSGEAA